MEFSGQRLKEGGHINKSLVTLGSVISALAEASKAIANQSKQVSFLNKISWYKESAILTKINNFIKWRS